MSNGRPTVCVPSPTPGAPCIRPYPNHADHNGGGPHVHIDAMAAAAPVNAGQSYLTSVINAPMNGPEWNSTAIFPAWDDWGGFYDHPRADVRENAKQLGDITAAFDFGQPPRPPTPLPVHPQTTLTGN